jgi:hypothetical protein
MGKRTKQPKDTRTSHEINPYASEGEMVAWKNALNRELKEAIANAEPPNPDDYTYAELRKLRLLPPRKKP